MCVMLFIHYIRVPTGP